MAENFSEVHTEGRACEPSQLLWSGHSTLSHKFKAGTVMEPKHTRSHLYQSVFILNIVYLGCGTTFAWSSPVLVMLNLTEAEGSSVASMLSLGSILGPFVCRAVIDVLGRKGTVGLSMGMLTLSWLLLTVAEGVTTLCIGRFIGGAMAGMTCSVIPIYIAEISEDSVRGLLNTLSQISICLGSLFVYCVGPFVSYHVLHYMMLGICIIFFFLFPFLPNSPYTLAMKNDIGLARDTLMWLRGTKSASAVEKELEEIQTTIRENRVEKGTIKELFTSEGSRRALLICCGLVTFQQISGISIVFFYSQKIFLMTGTQMSSSTCSIVVGIIMMLSSFITPVAVKHLGYKIPLLLSILGMALGMGGLGIFFLLKFNHFEIESLHWLPLLSLVVYILFFNSGFANIPWALSGELFTNKMKPQATAIISSTCGFFAFLSTNLFADLILFVGLDFLFITCSFFCCLGAIFVLLVVKDTSGLSFAEIQDLLNGQNRKEIQLKIKTQEDCKL